MKFKNPFKNKIYKDNEVTFYTEIVGLAETFPVVKASQAQPKWWKEAHKHINKQKALEGSTYIAKCPGIGELASAGWIIPLWHNITIEHDRSGEIRWDVPESFKNNMAQRGYNIHPVEFLPRASRHIPSRPGRVQEVFKFNIPWNFVAPKGIKMLYIPLSYHENIWYDAAPGILDQEKNNDLNINGWLTLPKGQKTTIQAGTPLAQIIPITERKLTHICRDANELEKDFHLRSELAACSRGRVNIGQWGRIFRNQFYGK